MWMLSPLYPPFYFKPFIFYNLLLFSLSVVSDSLRSHGLQHARLPCPSLFPWVCSNLCPLSWWWPPVISSSVIPFSSCPQSFPTSEPFPLTWLFTLGGQSIGTSASALVLPMNIQGWFPLELTGLISLQSHPYMTTGKNCSFDYMDLYRQSNVSVL